MKMFPYRNVYLSDYSFFTTSIYSTIQLTEEFEYPAKTGFANNSMIIDLRLRF